MKIGKKKTRIPSETTKKLKWLCYDRHRDGDRENEYAVDVPRGKRTLHMHSVGSRTATAHKITITVDSSPSSEN